MGSRVFTVMVLLSWGGSMAWLLSAKILPALRHGDPPASSLTTGKEPVAWSIEIGGKMCGFAVTQSVPGTLETTEVHSRVMLERVPLPSIAPEWMESLVDRIGDVDLDMWTRTTLDPMNRLSSFDTKVRLNRSNEFVRMYGRVEEGELRLRFQAGDFGRTAIYPWPENALLGGELTPEPKLIQAYVGRSWQREVYSPFASPHNPVESLEALVVEEEKISIRQKLKLCRRVEYRLNDSAGLSAEQRVRARLWVAEDGRVLRQEVRLMNTKLRFDRLPRTEAERLAKEGLDLNNRSAVGPIERDLASPPRGGPKSPVRAKASPQAAPTSARAKAA